MIVVTGATGNIGKVIAENLLRNGQAVRAIARNREHLKELEKLGAESFPGNVEDSSFLENAFRNADAVFLLNPPNLHAEDAKQYQKQVSDAFTTALSKTKVGHVVNLSSGGADLQEGTGPIAGLHYQEEKLNELKDMAILHLRPAYFMENFLINLPMIQSMGINGTPLKADVSFPMIATIDIGNYASGRLNGKNFAGKSVQYLMGPRDLTMQEATRILGKSIGKPELSYVQFPYEDALKSMVQSGLSRSVAESFIEMERAVNGGLIQFPPRTSENTTPTSFEKFAQTVLAPAFGR